MNGVLIERRTLEHRIAYRRLIGKGNRLDVSLVCAPRSTGGTRARL